MYIEETVRCVGPIDRRVEALESGFPFLASNLSRGANLIRAAMRYGIQ